DRFLCIGREPKYVARVSNRAVVAPFLQHLPVFGDLVLPLLGGDQIVGIDILKSDEHTAPTCLRRLFDEIRYFVAERIDLDGEAEAGKFGLAQVNEPIKQ